ncbi:3Beta-HSD domain-containing protein [Favolaschia claudopus]|uniref:3Beta-HSD domain-containing protein n=1 Tax=Favolaschia claudopus TaxID=2862362 RepID=A0AAW0DKY5_9AGAR
MVLAITIPVLLALAWYLRRLAVRLRRSPASAASRALNAYTYGGPEELDKVSYKDIDMLKAVPTATQAGYAVIGGSGFLGSYLVQLLIMRGEKNIRILDVNPPPSKILDHPSVVFVKTDVTSLESVRTALTAPFPGTGAPPTVIHHTAAIIRFWERASYCFPTSYRVNVLGTKNILTVAKELSAMVVYTSSAETVSGCPKFMRLDWDTYPVSIKDQDGPLPFIVKQACYPRSKRMAEQLVIEASKKDGLKTGILRPGLTIIGPNDRLVSGTLTMPRTPQWDNHWVATEICVWDCAAAHLLYEDALNRIPDEVSGQGFLITGRGPAWSVEDIRNAIKHYATRKLIFDDIPPLPIYIISHIMEAFLFLRYHLLLPFSLLFTGKRPSLVPRWLGPTVFLQPATLAGQLMDCIIDDSRAQKVLGYRPQWDTAQAIRYSVEEIESGNVPAVHGLKVQ